MEPCRFGLPHLTKVSIRPTLRVEQGLAPRRIASSIYLHFLEGLSCPNTLRVIRAISQPRCRLFRLYLTHVNRWIVFLRELQKLLSFVTDMHLTKYNLEALSSAAGSHLKRLKSPTLLDGGFCGLPKFFQSLQFLETQFLCMSDLPLALSSVTAVSILSFESRNIVPFSELWPNLSKLQIIINGADFESSCHEKLLASAPLSLSFLRILVDTRFVAQTSEISFRIAAPISFISVVFISDPLRLNLHLSSKASSSLRRVFVNDGLNNFVSLFAPLQSSLNDVIWQTQ